MKNSFFIHASEVADLLGISVAHSYKIVRELNKDLESKGYLTVSGKVSKDYFYEKIHLKLQKSNRLLPHPNSHKSS